MYLIFRVNDRKYSFGNEEGAVEWVCSKIPSGGRIKKDCVPKVSKYIFNHVIFGLLLERCPILVCAPYERQGLPGGRNFVTFNYLTFQPLGLQWCSVLL